MKSSFNSVKYFAVSSRTYDEIGLLKLYLWWRLLSVGETLELPTKRVNDFSSFSLLITVLKREVICIQILDIIMRQWSWNFQRALFPLNCKLEPGSLRRIRLELFSMLYFLLASGSKQCQMRCEMSRHKVFLGKKFESLVRSDVYHSMSGIDFRRGGTGIISQIIWIYAIAEN